MPRRRKVAGLCRSGFARSRSRYANPVSRWHWPRVARHGAAKSQVIELGTLHTQTRFDVAQALAIGQLREGHREVLVETREPLDLVLAGIAHDAAMKRVQRQMLQHLREHELAQVHRYLPRAARPQDGSATRRPRGSNRQLDERSLLQCFSMTCCNPSAQRWDTTDVYTKAARQKVPGSAAISGQKTQLRTDTNPTGSSRSHRLRERLGVLGGILCSRPHCARQ